MQLDQFKIVIDKFNNNNINILNYKNIPINKIDENIINFGLKKLAQWAEKNFKNIVIVWPVLAKQYLNINSKIINYSNKKLDELETSKKIINKYTEYLVSILPNAKILKYNDNFITRLYYYDFNNKNFEPNFVHLLTKNYEDIATNLLNLLKINYKDYYNEDLDYETLKIEKMKTDLEKLKAYSYNNIEHIYCHLVSYTNFINKLKNHIIVINGKGDIASKLRFYRNKNLIGTEKQNLKWNVLPNENYLAIIDTKNNFIYEKHSTDKIQYKYIIPNLKKEFSIESDKDKSSIIYDKKELSKDQLGLNFVIIDLNKNEVIDQAYCNISNDEYMLVTSKLFDKFNN